MSNFKPYSKNILNGDIKLETIHNFKIIFYN